MISFFAFKKRLAKGGDKRREVMEALERVLDSGVFILGAEGKKLEEDFAKYIGARFAVGVNSGTDAIFLSLKAFGIKEGDEVITVSHTATPTVSAIRLTGATPVFVDIDPETFCIDTKKIEEKITPKTKAIVPVHIYGYPCDMKAIIEIAERHDLFVVEDACQAHGAMSEGKKVGSIGHTGAWSFYPTKNLGCLGDGGMITTNDEALYEKLKALRNYGEVAKFDNAIEGVNTRLDEMQAAILNASLPHLDSANARRAEIAALYSKELSGLSITLPKHSDSRVWHLYVIRTDKRDALKEFLKEKGVETMIHYPTPVALQKAYTFLGYTESSLPETLKASRQILSLPMYPELSDSEVLEVASAIKEFFSK